MKWTLSFSQQLSQARVRGLRCGNTSFASRLLRPAWYRVSHRCLCRHRQGGYSARELVPAGRAHTLDGGRPVLLSWTGTLFEYLMPSLWMRSYSNTLLERSRETAVRSQQTYAARRNVPWGISESAYFKLDEAGNYQYYAFGLPHLALHKREMNALVISPYSTFLALDTDPVGAVRNLQEWLTWDGSGAMASTKPQTSLCTAQVLEGPSSVGTVLDGPPSRDEPSGLGQFPE